MKLKNVISEYKFSFVFTLSLLLFEVGLTVLFPLFIGYAIDGALKGVHTRAVYLGALGILVLFIGAGRRFFDTRFYARVFIRYGQRMIARIKDSNTSKKTARLGMLHEMVEFMENTLPELINNVIGMAGVVFIIATLNHWVFVACIIVLVIVFYIYLLSSKKTVEFNRQGNNEWEQQVNAIDTGSDRELSAHLTRLMKWNIKLSDLETVNFSLSWVFLMGFLVLSIVVSASNGTIQYGALFALVMYVFQFIEDIINLPLYYQQWLRLSEIKNRLEIV